MAQRAPLPASHAGRRPVAHREDHHPLMEVSYKTCRVHYSTHAVSGLTINDFICAAKLNHLIA